MIPIFSPSINFEEMMKSISQIDIAAYYLRIDKIPCVINSPLRTDVHPSFGIYENDCKVFFHDFSTGESGSIIDLLMKLYNLTFKEVLAKLHNEKYLILGRKCSVQPVSRRSKLKQDTSLQVKVRDWRDYDIEYWEKYGISLDWVKFSRTYPISYTIITTNNKRYTFPAEKYAYVYVEFKDGIQSLKVYQPYSSLYKWISKHDSSVWDLWDRLPDTGEKLIITSSRKDALCIWENSGIPAVSLQAESFLPKPQVVYQLKNRFDIIYVLYDNDFTKETNMGRLYGNKLSSEFNLKQIELPETLGCKDASDLALTQGRKAVYDVILSLTK